MIKIEFPHKIIVVTFNSYGILRKALLLMLERVWMLGTGTLYLACVARVHLKANQLVPQEADP